MPLQQYGSFQVRVANWQDPYSNTYRTGPAPSAAYNPAQFFMTTTKPVTYQRILPPVQFDHPGIEQGWCSSEEEEGEEDDERNEGERMYLISC
jgi:hypothetical protein